jgi:hypothetical protein
LSHPPDYGSAMPINSQRWFMRKEDHVPRQTPPESPCRCFDVKCLKCDCYKMTVTAHYNEQTGESFVVFFVAGADSKRKSPQGFNMNTESNQTITVKIVGELTIRGSDLKQFFPQNVAPPVMPPPQEAPKPITIETEDGLPRLSFSMKETAKILGVSYITVHRLLQRGLLKSSFACRTKIISKTEIERFLKETSRSAYE